MKECPKEKCFHWVASGSYLIPGVFGDVQEALVKGKWEKVNEAKCSCNHKCNRIYEYGEADFYEPALGDNGEWANPDL